MKNFKEIADKCLAGELSGTFVLRNGDKRISSTFKKDQGLVTSFSYAGHFYYSDNGRCYTIAGHKSEFDVIDFIPDNMQKKIEIDIPEGKVPVMEQTESGLVITWKKELEYNDIFNYLWEHNAQIGLLRPLVKTENTDKFNEKVNVLCKLTNIRNYFGKPDGTKAGYYIKSTKRRFQVAQTGYPCLYASDAVVFKEKEHAEQAIKMLGDELKYLFEPW